MKNYLNIAIAARKMGIKRSLLQEKVFAGEISSMDGMVDFDELKEKCISARIFDRSPMIEKMKFIKDNAYSNRVATAHLPDVHTMYSRIKKLRLELKMERVEKNKQLVTINEAIKFLLEYKTNTDAEKQLIRTVISRLKN